MITLSKALNKNKALNQPLQGLLSNLSKVGLSIILLNCLSIFSAKSSDSVVLTNIFLSDTGSLVLETKDKKELENFELLKSASNKHKLILNGVDLDKKLVRNFNESHANYKISKETIKESLFKKKKKVSIELSCTSDCEAEFEPLLGGLAYTVNLTEAKKTFTQEPVLVAEEDSLDLKLEDKEFVAVEEPKEKQFQVKELGLAEIKLDQSLSQKSQKQVHMLQANKKTNMIFELSKDDSPVDEFLNDLDDNLSQKLFSNKDFRRENIAKADSASLSHIAQTLQGQGRNDLSADAYAKALEVDPTNLNAMLGLARTTKNPEQKLNYYLKAIDDEALMNIGQKWFEKGKASGDQKQIAQAMISYQFAVLKNPENPYYRYQYAQVLEESGYSNFDQASKRYLEAAVLAKKDYQAGDTSKESILRKSTECLIKVLTKKGAPEKAVHYCNSYRALGFNKFLDGRSIKGVMKEISSNKNPFQA